MHLFADDPALRMTASTNGSLYKRMTADNIYIYMYIPAAVCLFKLARDTRVKRRRAPHGERGYLARSVGGCRAVA